MELIEQPVAGASPSAVWVFLAAKGGYWLGVGVVWAILAQLAEPRLGFGALVLLGLLTSIAMSLALLIPTAMSRLTWFGAGGPVGSIMGILPRDARLAHLLWTNCSTAASISRSSPESAARRDPERCWRVCNRSGQVGDADERGPTGGLPATASTPRRHRCASRPEGALPIESLEGRRSRRPPCELLRPAVRSLRAKATTFAAELDLAGRYLGLRSATTGGLCTISVDPCPVPGRLSRPGCWSRLWNASALPAAASD